MKSIFLLTGETFTDENIYKFIDELGRVMLVQIYENCNDKIDIINAECEQGNIFYLETNKKTHTEAYCQAVKAIKYKPSAVYLLPHAPKKLVNYIKSFWCCEIYVFPYDKLQPAKQIKY